MLLVFLLGELSVQSLRLKLELRVTLELAVAELTPYNISFNLAGPFAVDILTSVVLGKTLSYRFATDFYKDQLAQWGGIKFVHSAMEGFIGWS